MKTKAHVVYVNPLAMINGGREETQRDEVYVNYAVLMEWMTKDDSR